MNRIEKRPEGVGTKPLNIIACLTFFVFSVFPFHLSFAAEEVSTVMISVNEQGATIIIDDGKSLEVAAGDGWRTFTLSSGETIGVFIDPRTDAPSIKIYSGTGTVHVLAGDTTTTVPEGAAMSVTVNHETGAASVTAIAGTIQVEAGTTTTTVPEGSTMAASVDTETGAATVIAVTGTVEVTSEGERVLVQQGEATTASPGEPPAPPVPVPPVPPPPPPSPELPTPPDPPDPPPDPPHSPFS